ncbi:4-hydroxythreonine-4-phosphate dehydrogenase [Bacteroidia bacterium]|nr:4-hydroxythreonine-4-phosphate dehydrogenase [Bacteroidia bacterium]GHT61900.1 4-hydroxythreonine-4-phosphate dehydrogenase [Bacteroidia bacterium]
MSDKLIKVGISQGDINGISYELIIKTFEDVRIFEFCIPVLYGSSKVLAYHRKAMELPSVNVNTIHQAGEAGINRLNIINCGNEEIAVDFSKSSPESESLAQRAMQKALSDLKAGLIDVLVLGPSNLEENQYFPQQQGNTPLKILVYNSFRMALASDKIPLSDVSPQLATNLLVDKIKALQASLIHDFSVTLPRIAVLSFNPGMGIRERKEGREETEIIIPAIKTANESGVVCFGPYSADGFFASCDYTKFDAILAIYYDQGLIPFRSVSSDEGVVYFAGLPFVVTAPDHGVSYDKAGKNESSEASFRNALYLAVDLFQTRKLDKEIYANPLKKQYFEKGSDNEKLDLTKDEE